MLFNQSSSATWDRVWLQLKYLLCTMSKYLLCTMPKYLLSTMSKYLQGSPLAEQVRRPCKRPVDKKQPTIRLKKTYLALCFKQLQSHNKGWWHLISYEPWAYLGEGFPGSNTPKWIHSCYKSPKIYTQYQRKALNFKTLNVFLQRPWYKH